MSLDVCLKVKEPVLRLPGIPIREDGTMKMITREEWDERFPEREPIEIPLRETDEVYCGNITHNLGKMAGEAGIYEHLWRPDEIGISKAKQLIEPLQAGLDLLKSNPERFRVFNPENKWGDYEGLVRFVSSYLAACQVNPDADVSVSR